MLKLMKVFEDIMVAVTFAEAGEFDEASRIAGNEIPQDEKDTITVLATNSTKPQ
jgi:hypothetical protein